MIKRLIRILNKRLSRRGILVSSLLIVLLIAGLPILHFPWMLRDVRAFHASYQRLMLGMTEAEIVVLFSREPDSICTLNSNRILYYSRRYIGDPVPTPARISVRSQRDISGFYGSAELLIETDGKLSAFSINGEALYLTTREGKPQGSRLQSVEPAIFDKLCRPALEIQKEVGP